jgi:hypothetical protein
MVEPVDVRSGRTGAWSAIRPVVDQAVDNTVSSAVRTPVLDSVWHSVNSPVYDAVENEV